MSTVSNDATSQIGEVSSGGLLPVAVRILGWSLTMITLLYLVNNYLNLWQNWPGAMAVFGQLKDPEASTALSVIQVLCYIFAVCLSAVYVLRSPMRSLRLDAKLMMAITNFIIRFAFWAVVLIGIVDAIISFLRVEGLLGLLVGTELESNLGRSHFRAPFVHMPLLLLALFLAIRARTLGFQWLALLVVGAELFIVLTRFIFSYEQAFQGDLVRFWYAALFLFASAYTLFEDGHVRVDVLYAGFDDKTKGLINAVGSILLGVTLCWTILIFGLWDKSSIINSALIAFETSQTGYGMYVKFWMAGFLAVFAVSMTIQFCSYLLEGVADFRGEPGRREPPPVGGH